MFTPFSFYLYEQRVRLKTNHEKRNLPTAKVPQSPPFLPSNLSCLWTAKGFSILLFIIGLVKQSELNYIPFKNQEKKLSSVTTARLTLISLFFLFFFSSSCFSSQLYSLLLGTLLLLLSTSAMVHSCMLNSISTTLGSVNWGLIFANNKAISCSILTREQSLICVPIVIFKDLLLLARR